MNPRTSIEAIIDNFDDPLTLDDDDQYEANDPIDELINKLLAETELPYE